MSTGTSSRTDTQAVLALVLAVLVPPVGLALALFAKGTEGGRRSGLRTAAVVVGLIGTVLGTMLLVLWLGNAFDNG